MRVASALILIVVLGAGCSSNPDQSPPALIPRASATNAPAATPGVPVEGEPTASTLPSEMVTEYVLDPETGEVTQVANPAPGPSTYGELVDAGIEAGLWDELVGLELVLGHAVGAVSRDRVPAVDSVATGELNDVLDRANALALGGRHSDDELRTLRRWFELAMPSPDLVERFAAAADRAPAGAGGNGTGAVLARQPASGSVGVRSAVAVGGDCAPVAPEDFDGDAVIEGCYLMYEDSVEGVTLRVIYPAWYHDDELLKDLPLRAREALVQSAVTFAPLAPIGDMDVIFSLVDTAGSGGTLAVATVDAQWGTATRGGSCPITVFPNADRPTFEGTIAHEAWHCVQRESGYLDSIPQGHAWYLEAGAEYFANLVYPKNGWLGVFDRKSPTTSLFDMSYEAWVWWQYLGSRQSPRAVADMHNEIGHAGDAGRAAMSGNGPIFQRFVINYVAGVIPSPGGGSLPEPTSYAPPIWNVGKNDTGKELTFETDVFVAVRWVIEYEQELRVFESETIDSGTDVAMVLASERRDPAAWRGVFPEVRSKCDDKIQYVLIATTEEGKKSAEIKVDSIEEAVCDPCLLGTWDLDLDSFQSMIEGTMDQAGGLPPGVSFDISGHYYISFDDEGLFFEQRDGLGIKSTFQGFSMNSVIDSFAHGSYNADGENVEVTDLTDDFVSVTLGDQSFAQESQILNGVGTYECRTDDMTLTVDGFEPVQWTRVDKILEPPPVPDQ